jgi:hypothetical protein
MLIVRLRKFLFLVFWAYQELKFDFCHLNLFGWHMVFLLLVPWDGELYWLVFKSQISLTYCVMFILFIHCYIWFIHILLKIFVTMFLRDTTLVFFCCGIFMWFWYHNNVGIIKSIGEVFLLFLFLPFSYLQELPGETQWFFFFRCS